MLSRKSLLAAALAASLAGLVAAPAAARPHGGDAPWSEGRGAHRAEHLGRMLRELDLSDAQRDKLFEIRHAAAPQMREKLEALRKSRAALREAATAADYDAARVRARAEESAKLQADLTVMRIENQQKMLSVLTPEQREKLAGLRAERRRR